MKSVSYEASLEFERVYDMSLERMRLKLLQDKLNEQAEASFAQRTLAEREMQEKEKALRKSAAYKQHADFLNSQRELALQKKVQTQIETAKPGISPDFHGYPSIPETPKEQRRLNQLEQQKRMKAELEQQIAQQRLVRERTLQQQKLKDKDRVQSWNREAEEERLKAQMKKHQYRDTLLKAWQRVELAKQVSPYMELTSTQAEASEHADPPVHYQGPSSMEQDAVPITLTEPADVLPDVQPEALLAPVKPHLAEASERSSAIVIEPKMSLAAVTALKGVELRRRKAQKLKDQIDEMDRQRYFAMAQMSSEMGSVYSGASKLSSNGLAILVKYT
jgi:hypothetical protein